MKRFSFCITCMDRLEHLKQTIFLNLYMVSIIQNSEIVLLNYSSNKDDIDNFVEKYLRYYEENGFLTYISMSGKEKFFHAHAKNIAHKNSNGEILVNLDVDNLLSIKYLEILHNVYKTREDAIVRGVGKTGAYGRIAISRENFFKLGGYNEKLRYYGGEDTDLIERAELYLGCTSHIIQEKELPHIHHSDEIRKMNIDDDDIQKSYQKNRTLMDYYKEKQIMNPNEYEGINWGEI